MQGGTVLPDESGQPWPPASWSPIQQDIAEAEAWYSGDEAKLAGIYGGLANTPARSRWYHFWSRRDNPDTPTRGPRLHVPAAADVAATSADLLFGDAPTWKMAEAHTDTPSAPAQAAEAHLAALIDADGWSSTLLEAAEIASGLGGVWLRPTWDTDTAEHALLTVMHPDQAVPEFRYGQVVAVTFWRTLESTGTDDKDTWRHLERHSPGMIEHGLYKGTSKTLGVRYPLTAHGDTRALDNPDGGTIDIEAEIGLKVLLPAYVPNVRPNRKHRTKPIGRSDCANTEHLMDALDEVWSSWVRDIRLGKARIIVPNSMLDRNGRGGGAAFDTDQEVFSPLEIDPGQAKDAGITPVEFNLRVAEHEQSARALFTQIVQTAGYSPQSFGLPGNGAAQTATEVDARTDRSTRTTARKRGYWRNPLGHVGLVALAIERGIFRRQVEPMRPVIDFTVAGDDDARSTAETLNLLSMAKAASIDTKVRMLHPEWTEAQVSAEVERIAAEEGAAVADPTGGFE